MESAIEAALGNPSLGLLLLDEENRTLLQDVRKMEASQGYWRWKTYSQNDSNTGASVKDMENMLTRILELVGTHKKDIENEVKKERSAATEAEGLLRHCQKYQEHLDKIQEASDKLENDLVSYQREMEDLQRGLSGDQGLLKELLDHLADSENNNLMLLQFSAADASKIKDLSVRLERVSSLAAAAECELDSSQAESSAARTTLENLGGAFLQAASNRDQVLAQWESVLQQVYDKSTEHTNTIEEHLASQRKMSQLREKVEQEADILHQVERSRNEVLQQKRTLEEESTYLSTQRQIALNTREQIEGQVSSLRICLTKAGKDIENLQIQLAEQKTLRAEKEQLIANIHMKCKKAEKRLELNSELVMTLEEAMNAMEGMIKENETTARNLTKQRDMMIESQLRHLRDVQELKHQEKIIKGETKSLTQTKVRTVKHSVELNTQKEKQTEVQHDQDFQITSLRRKIHDLTYTEHKPDPEQLKIEEGLKQRLAETITAIYVITKQLQVLKTSRAKEQKLLVLVRRREEVCVDASLTQLHLQRRMDRLRTVVNKAVNIHEEKQDMEKLARGQMEAVMERLMYSDQQIRDLNAESHRLALQLHDVTTRIQQLKDKYESIKLSFNGPDGDCDTELSATQIELRIAGERSGLQETGDMLDGEVRRAEEEVEALQQILQLLSMEGQEYRSQLHDVLHHGEEHAEKRNLETIHSELNTEIELWKGRLREALDDLEVHLKMCLLLLKSIKRIMDIVCDRKYLLFEKSRSRISEVELQVSAVEELLREKNVHMVALERETEDLRIKVKHSKQAVISLLSRTRCATDIQADIELRLLQDMLKSIHTLLGELASAHPDTIQALQMFCQSQNIPPPEFSRLTKRDGFGSRSSLGTLGSSRSGGSRPGSRADSTKSHGGLSSARSAHSARSHISSTHSQDSGRSVSPGGMSELSVSSRSPPRVTITVIQPDRQGHTGRNL
ncbi:unnamed protein product, partial [Meganyctiphanes norvegica]